MTEPMEFINGNQVALGDDGFALLAPFGDSIYPLKVGSKTENVVQRITRENATEMVNAFKSVVGKVSRWLRGSPIFLGHPDDPQQGHKYPVKDQVGMFADLEVRENGLYVRPMFNSKGAEVLDGPQKHYFSGRWPVKLTGQHNGMPVYEPINVTSIGMTPRPNLPTEMLNTETNIMEKTKLLGLLATLGLTLSNESTDEQILDGIKGIKTARDTVETELANERTAHTATKAALTQKDVELANARNTEIASLINERITTGAITEAEKPLWTKRLEVNFVNEAPALKALPSKLKTEPNPAASGNRARNPSSQNEAGAKLIQFANEQSVQLLKANPSMLPAEAYRLGYKAASESHPELVTQLSS